jgi:hypothetical protein
MTLFSHLTRRLKSSTLSSTIHDVGNPLAVFSTTKTSRNKPNLRARLGVELLEDRTVPTANVWLTPNTQTVAEGALGGLWVHR